MSKLLCFGDLHLGAHPEYGRAPGDRLRVQANVLEQIAALAVDRDVAAILNLGDTFDGPGIPPEQLDIYARFVEVCHVIQIPVIAISGNGKHDAAMRDINGMEIFNRIPGSIVHSKPALVDLADGVTIACLPWVHPGRLIAARNGQAEDRDDVNREAAQLLVATARGLRDQITDGYAILAIHGSVSGATTPDGALTDLFREPVLDAGALADLGYDAIVCGHIHRAQQMSRELPFFYVGSPLPLNFGEASCDHGVCILDTTEPDEIDFVATEVVPLTSPAFVTIEHDYTDWGDLPDFEPATIEPLPEGAVVRFRYRATSEQQRHLDTALMRYAYLDAGAAVVKIVPEIVREDRARVGGVDETLAPLAALELYLDANEIAGERAERTRARTALYLESAAA